MVERSATDRDGPSTTARPADEVLDAVRDACRRLYAVEDEFVRRFRDCLGQLVPELRHTTHDQGATIAEGLAHAVLWAGLTSDPPAVVELTFHNLGTEYARRGFPESGYHGAGHALLRAARDTQLGDWTSELSSAWVAFYAWLSSRLTMDLRTVDASPEPAPAEPGTVGYPPVVRPPVPGPSPAAARPGGPLQAARRPPDQHRPQAQGGPERRPRPQAHHHPQFESQLQPRRPRQPAPAPSSGIDGGYGSAVGGAAGPATLDEALELLRSRYFAGNERALGSILTRVALRTGADLRAPRPDQRTNPAVVANVVAVLQVMGYVLQPGGSEAVQRVISPAGREAESPSGRWWNRRRSPPPRRWRGSLPGTFR
jgi:hemoglobin-like flavoprotein